MVVCMYQSYLIAICNLNQLMSMYTFLLEIGLDFFKKNIFLASTVRSFNFMCDERK